MRFGALQPAVEPLALVRLAQEVRRDVVDRLLQLVALGDEQVRLAGGVLDLSHRADLRVCAQTSVCVGPETLRRRAIRSTAA